MILAGDIGGTNTRLALVSVESARLDFVVKKVYPSKDYPALDPILREFVAGQAAAITAACFGIAGPVVDNQVRTPNLPWLIYGEEIARCLGIGSVALLNDLEATAYGVLTLDENEFAPLNAGSAEPRGNIGLIAAGTGLGEAILYPVENEYRTLASEAGHADFAARSGIELELLSYLAARFDHVSYERVISGPGLLNIYSFLKDSGRSDEPPWLRERIAEGDPAAVVSQAALANEAPICVKTLELFVSAYGAEAGNLALRAKALGGIYVGGGIAPRILPKLSGGGFMSAFLDKGRYREFVSRVPVRVILNEDAALRGAAYYAAAVASS